MSEAAALVRKYGEGQCKFDELVGFVKCQECFSIYGRATGLYNDEGGGEEEGGDGGEG